MKDGFKSSEFISAWGASALAAAGGSASDSPIVQGCALIAMGLAIGLYSLGRGISKKAGS